MVENNLMHKIHLPFTREKMIDYFQNPKHIGYFEKSIDRYKEYENNKALKEDWTHKRQLEKDERFWTARYLIALFEKKEKERKDILIKLLKDTYGEIPPFDDVQTWEELLNTQLHLLLEVNLPAPKKYKLFLSKHLDERQFVPYVLEQGTRENGKDTKYRKNLEGATQVDALIFGENGFNLLIEAKVLSDISCQIMNDINRNQIARNVDVMLEDKSVRLRSKREQNELIKLDKNKSLFLLLTPKIFKDEFSKSRLYRYKMDEYKTNFKTLKEDLKHRGDLKTDNEWINVTKRIGWITWEKLEELGL